MKKQFLAVIILVAAYALVTVSCDKKSTNTMNMDIQMTYAPNPAKVDSNINFTFEVKENGMMTSVDSYSCDVVMGASMDTMHMVKSGTGVYIGTRKFTAAGT